MSRQPSVSVVVPTRDRPELLRAAARAILAQEYPGPIEVVVVFDQSTPDESLTGLSAPDRAVRVIRNERTPGLAGARNSGTLAAEGELVAFCDDDDEWLPGKLAAQVDALAADPSAEFVCCGIRVSYDGHTVDRVLEKDRVTLDDLLRDRMTELHPSTFLIRATALRDGFGLVDEEIPGSYAEDYEFLLRAARSAPLINLRTPSVLVRWHKRSYFAQRWDTISEALQWLLRRYPEFAGQPAGEARVTGQIAFARAASGDRRGALRWARRTLRRNPREPRAYLALAVAGRVVRADAVLRTLHKRGRGI
ncbi:Glycosyltransferase involved in cell wall bisynthesis [Micromonospora coriariae]|uniref:Glycosyltransferase involved in cell wall bisynthesis n=1 Tax=Micromonospora coriariae TaxID=285665 RepID=A0A1C4UAL5_9ACTN|nr:glycosyltransferase family 2 protein [Micromonospora coriariae]SCE68659.1 Glycosyltransferase involved in cell wall bisynthesis [Micromonospora coriariae]